MTGIIITGHGTFPLGFLSACELIAGDLNRICGVCFDREPEQLEHALLPSHGGEGQGGGQGIGRLRSRRPRLGLRQPR